MLLKMGYLSGFKALPNILFFLVHYGAFCAAHGTFIAEFFAGDLASGFSSESESALSSFDDSYPLGIFVESFAAIFNAAGTLWWWAFAGLVASHLVSFLFNWIGQGEYRQDTSGSLMTAPYRRLVILHVTVLLGGVAVTEMGSPVYLVAVLVLMKITLDVFLHRREHSAPGRAFNPAAGSRN